MIFQSKNNVARIDVAKTTKLRDDIAKINHDLSSENKLKGRILDIQEKLEDLNKARLNSHKEEYIIQDDINFKQNGKCRTFLV